MPSEERDRPRDPHDPSPNPSPCALAPWGFTLPAEPAAAGLARLRIRRWLQRLDWPGDLVDDIEHAVSEAVSNAAEHAYPPGSEPGTVRVRAEVEAGPDGLRRIRIRVRDHGRWRPTPPDPRHRGRGLLMMAAMMAEVVIRHGDELSRPGTEVMLLSPPAGPTP